MLHLAWDNVFMNMVATGKKIDWVPGQKFNWHDGEKIDWPDGYLENSSTAQGKDSVVYYVSKSYDIALQYIKGLDPNKYGEITGMRDITDTPLCVAAQGIRAPDPPPRSDHDLYPPGGRQATKREIVLSGFPKFAKIPFSRMIVAGFHFVYPVRARIDTTV
jgi:hypothetical protein